jgi:hypothetical protein
VPVIAMNILVMWPIVVFPAFVSGFAFALLLKDDRTDRSAE